MRRVIILSVAVEIQKGGVLFHFIGYFAGRKIREVILCDWRPSSLLFQVGENYLLEGECWRVRETTLYLDGVWSARSL